MSGAIENPRSEPLAPAKELASAATSNRVDFDQYAANYDTSLEAALRTTGEDKSFYCQGRIALLRGLLPLAPRNIMDFGCGTGAAVPLLQQLQPDASVTGVDVSARSLDVARESYPTAHFYHLSSPDAGRVSNLDLVHVNGVFHHIVPGERQSWLQWINQRMVAGGVLAIFENNPWNPGTRYVMSNCEFDRDAVMLSQLETTRHMQEAGFSVLGCWHLFFFPRAMKWLRFAEPCLRRVPLGGQYLCMGKKASPEIPSA
ncbi:MAG TPA: methyltransferase [Terriglobales bacterium]|nr:methyltransferase [Terriglobales bacterium]